MGAVGGSLSGRRAMDGSTMGGSAAGAPLRCRLPSFGAGEMPKRPGRNAEATPGGNASRNAHNAHK